MDTGTKGTIDAGAIAGMVGKRVKMIGHSATTLKLVEATGELYYFTLEATPSRLCTKARIDDEGGEVWTLVGDDELGHLYAFEVGR